MRLSKHTAAWGTASTGRLIKGLFQAASVLIMAAAATSCRSVIERQHVTPQGDTVAFDHMITEARVGRIFKGMDIARVQKVYGETHVKKLISDSQEGTDSLNTGRYYIFDDANKLLMVVTASDNNGSEQTVERIQIRDGRFRTASGIGIDSRVSEIRSAYPTLSVVTLGDRVALYLPDIDAYMGINPAYVHGFDPHFETDIPADSIYTGARTQNLTVNWNGNRPGVLSHKFWKETLRKAITWIVLEIPALAFLTLIFVSLLKLVRVTVRRVNRMASDKAIKDGGLDAHENEKRVATISGIIGGISRIMLWVIFLLIFLSRLGINIAPILASAGIVGLAVGFGAQELVRDFISGFFIILEDHLRTGDWAVINGVQGLVEKIELRTITLRDSAGVVHVIQNGKINSLSNMTKEWSAMVINIGVAYKENVDRVMDVMREVGEGMFSDPEFGPLMLESLRIDGVDSLDDSCVTIRVIAKTMPLKQWAVKREFLRRIKNTFDSMGIEIPYPHLSIYTGEATGPMPIEIVSEKENAE